MNTVVQNAKGDRPIRALRPLLPTNKLLRDLAVTAALAFTLTIAIPARGAVDIGVDTSFSGTAPRSSTTPWIDSSFQDIGPNRVRLTITAPNLSNPEYLQSLYLNFNDIKQVTSLIF